MNRLLIGVAVSALCVSTSFAGFFTRTQTLPSTHYTAISVPAKGSHYTVYLRNEDAAKLGGQHILVRVPKATPAASR